MGLECPPDIAQAIIESTLAGINDADVYIGNVGAFSKDWDHHVQLLATILCRLRENGFTINPLRPSRKLTGLVTGLLQEESNLGKRKLRQSCTWIALAMPMNYECSLGALIITMICGRAGLTYFKPLTDHSSLKKKGPIPWTDDMQKEFDQIHALMAADALAAYIQTTINGLISITLHMIFNWALALCKKAGQLPTSHASCRRHSRIIL